MKKALFVMIALVIGLFASIVSAQLVPVTVTEVKVNGDVVTDSTTNYVLNQDRNDEISVRVSLVATAAASDVELTAFLSGYEHNDKERVSDSTDVFDVATGVTYKENLKLKLPQRLKTGQYRLRILVTDRNSEVVVKDYFLSVDNARHNVVVKDVIMSPSFGVEAGRALLTTVRLENYGKKTEEGLKVTVSVPALGLSASDYVDELKKDEETTSEELFLRVPTNAAAGDYKATVTVTYNDGEDQVSKDLSLKVLGEATTAPAANSGKTVITLAAESQDVVKGTSGAVYPLTLTNTGSASKTYTLDVNAGGWANVKVSPSNVVVLKGGETKAVFLHVAANDDAAAGEQLVTLEVESGDVTLKELVLRANVSGQEPASASGLKRALEVGLVVLVVLLVVLGLVIGFNKLKGDEEGEEGQTYY
jgi:uncharacterized membrane protein